MFTLELNHKTAGVNLGIAFKIKIENHLIYNFVNIPRNKSSQQVVHVTIKHVLSV